jgi:ABC-type phosphate/phosphonate transport system substrate-binding protein
MKTICVLFIAIAAAAGLAVPAPGEGAARPAAVRIGVMGSVFRDTPEAMIQVVTKPLRTLMEEQTGMTPELRTVADAEGLGRHLAENKVQLGVFHGFEFGWARQKHPGLKPLMVTVGQAKQLRACLLVPAGSPVQALADLKGRTLALPCRSRAHCHLYLERCCEELGAPAEQFFAKVAHPPSAEHALDHVVDGAAHAALVEHGALANYQDRKPGRYAKLRVAAQSRLFPASVVAYQAGALDDATLERFREGMLNAGQNKRGQQLLTLCQIAGFERVPADYDQQLLETLKAYPPPAGAGK